MKPRLLLLLVITLYHSTILGAQQCNGGGGDDENVTAAPPPKHTNIVLVGATGDLAKKYIWKALFDLFSKHYIKGKTAFTIYGCARAPADSGRNLLSQIMLDVVSCKDDKDCRQVKSEFVGATQYHQLKDEKHYKALAEKIDENTQSMYGLQGADWTSEEGRLFYLSIPPESFARTAKLIHTHLRPKLSNPWVRLVIEKPFGSDKKSAEKLADKIGKYFKEEEVYRIDHYLGKPVVKAILPFREKNVESYEPIWNHHHIQRVEIVMKEMHDLRGRIAFYEQTGVIRDVMQNHLTEILALVAMDLPGSRATINQILNNKIQVLKSVEKLDISRALIGQYHEYPAELQMELNRTGTDYDGINTPTFAAALLHVNNARWKGVPFVLMSGKKLDEKTSYVRVLFKNTKFCLDKNSESCDKTKQLIFHISNSDVNKPAMIFASNGLPSLKPILGWKRMENQYDFTMFGEGSKSAQFLVADSSLPEAYSALIGSVFEAQRHMFTSHDMLISAWEIWSDVLVALNQSQPRAYEGLGRDSHMLDFEVKGKTLEFVHESKFEPISMDDHRSFGSIPSEFKGSKIVSKKTGELFVQLGKDIEKIAYESISHRGAFHIAFSGGKSPRKLLRHLATKHLTFPWQQTHIWMVDERCVSFSHDASNFKMVDDELLQNIQIPIRNIHPMPVQLKGEICDVSDGGVELYEAEINRSLQNSSFDFILLGVGMDTHTASLFPNQPELNTESLVAMATLPETVKVETKQRMTLTFEAINKAKHIAVLVTGKVKHDVLKTVEECDTIETCPILGVQNNSLVWYIDYPALFGK